MRERAQERGSKTLGLRLGTRLVVLLGQEGALQGERGLGRERLHRLDLLRLRHPVGRLRPHRHQSQVTVRRPDGHEEDVGISVPRGARPGGGAGLVHPPGRDALRNPGEELAGGQPPSRGVAVELLCPQRAHLSRDSPIHVAGKDREDLAVARRPCQVTVERGDGRGPSFALLRLERVLPDYASQPAHRERHDQHDDERKQVGRVVNIERVVRGDEQEIERRDAEQRRQE